VEAQAIPNNMQNVHLEDNGYDFMLHISQNNHVHMNAINPYMFLQLSFM